MSVPSSRRTAYHHGNLRHDLVRATRELLRETPPDAFKLSDACKLAGVSAAAPYRHFGDREALLDAVAVAGFEALGDAMRESLDTAGTDSLAAIAAIGRAYVAFACAEPHLFRLMFARDEAGGDASARDAEPDPERQPIECAGRAVYEILLRRVAHHLGRDALDEPVVRAAFPLWTFVHGLSGLLIDNALGVNRLSIDTDAVIDEVTARLLA